MNKTIIYIKAILLPVLIGALVGIITSGSMDYNMLQKPPFAPPGAVFPIVWTILYILMGISYGILKSDNQTDEEIDWIYYIQLAINALWSIIFFNFKWRLFAFIWILILDALVIDMIIKFYKKDKKAGLLQIPYLIWISFATILNLAVYLLNK